jgi:hypothetical protein
MSLYYINLLAALSIAGNVILALALLKTLQQRTRAVGNAIRLMQMLKKDGYTFEWADDKGNKIDER